MLFATVEMTTKLIDNFLGLLQETGIISLLADWHILSDIIPETINMGDISAPYYLLISKVADCNVSWHLSAWPDSAPSIFPCNLPIQNTICGNTKKIYMRVKIKYAK